MPLTIPGKCSSCKHRRSVPGDAHIRCANPDPNMTGYSHGIRQGWFYYPILFDPVWMTKECCNYESTIKAESASSEDKGGQ